MTTNTIPDVPIPAGYTADVCQDDTPQPYRILFGELCNTDGVKSVGHVNISSTHGAEVARSRARQRKSLSH